MRPLEIALHGATLASCVALGAGLWSVSQRETPPPPAPSVSEADLQALSREVAGLKREIADFRQPYESLPLRAVTPAPGAPGTAEPAAVMAALEDPKVQERIQALLETRLEAERKERQDRWQERGREFVEQRVKAFEEKAGMNDSQKILFSDMMKEVTEHLDAVRAKVRAKELTRDQAQEDLTRFYADLDLRVQAVMTADQFKQYQEWSQPFRDMAARGGFGGEDTGRRRRNRENPVP